MPDDFNIGNLDPGWISDGGVSGGEVGDYEREDEIPWETRAWSSDEQDNSGGGGGTCTPSVAPPTGTYIWGSVDGECQWIDTTDCSA